MFTINKTTTLTLAFFDLFVADQQRYPKSATRQLGPNFLPTVVLSFDHVEDLKTAIRNAGGGGFVTEGGPRTYMGPCVSLDGRARMARDVEHIGTWAGTIILRSDEDLPIITGDEMGVVAAACDVARDIAERIGSGDRWIVDEVERLVARAHERMVGHLPAGNRLAALAVEVRKAPTLAGLIAAHRLYADAEEQGARFERVAVTD